MSICVYVSHVLYILLPMVRFVHTADWQLGQCRDYLDEDAQTRLNESRIEAISAIGSLAVEESCSFVVVCGDVFEHNQVNRRVLSRALSAMKEARDVVFYLLPGNHDPLNASSIYYSPDFQSRPDNVYLLDSADPVEIEPGVELIGAPWPNKEPTSDLVTDACSYLSDDALDNGRVRIVVGHGGTDTLAMGRVGSKTISTTSLESLIGQGRIHYVALGDRHSTTSVGNTGRIWYSGSPEPTDFRETDPGNVLIVDVDEQIVEVTPKPVGRWSFVEEARVLTSGEDVDLLGEWLTAISDKKRAIVQLDLSGQVSVKQKARLDEILASYCDEFAHLTEKSDWTSLVLIPDNMDEQEVGLSGYALATWNELKAEALSSNPEKARIAKESLAIMYRIAKH
ncbi:MAG: DNA repair exonuclease [Acidimicrobiia bacterium]|nr:DNA repair exonuclease [Acidimicrobiia bacterium]MYI30370.1 DNA repair exonuclease [Acidimicrobiia bacterium]